MLQTTFYSWRAELDPDATREAYLQLPPADPACCSACATFLEALRRHSFPRALLDFLADAGADPAKAQDVWGVPEAGFLNGWWLVVGRMLDAEWQGEGERAFVEPVPGMKLWISGQPSMLPPGALEGKSLLHLEFEWYHPQDVVTLATAALKDSSARSVSSRGDR